MGKLATLSTKRPLVPVALTFSLDEPAIGIRENVQRVMVPTKGGKSKRSRHSEDHRILSILLVRDGTVYEYTEDLGLASMYPDEGFILQAAEEPIGPLLEWAERRRWTVPFHVRAGIGPSFTFDGYRQAVEERWKQEQRMSVFGTAYKRQRD